MKSHIDKAYLGEAFATDMEWEKVVLELPELFQAIREDAVVPFIREVLRPKYGNSPMFYTVVGDVSQSVLLVIANKLESAIEIEFALTVMISPTMIHRAEKMMEVRVQQAKSLSYWRGENTPIEEQA